MRALLLLGWLLLAPAPAPAIGLDRAEAAVGETITVALSGWPSGNVLVEVCGNERRGGSGDCAVSGGVTAVVLDGGATRTSLPLSAPPVACPCVVAATGVTGGAVVTAPLRLTGAPETAPAPAAQGTSRLTIVGTAMPDGPSWWWLFGMSGTSPLEITVRNDGTAPAVDPPVTLSAGPRGAPGAVVAAPGLGTIQPGEQRTFRVEVPLEGPVFGDYEITGTVQDAVVRAGDSVYPFALLALLVVPLHLTTAWIVFSAPIPASGRREQELVPS
ncbi:hypothetical protein [Nonomuraea sp. NPDC050643]|uniref:hypothetical protein n=1 Tax=Nonomuraea sp. NPDC050643 TaxID=3155660 RepID=UPI0033C32AC2